MPAYAMVLARPRPDKAEDAASYSQATAPLLAAAGGKAIVRGPVSKMVAGEHAFALGIVLEFPDANAAEAFFAHEAYKALIPLRDEAFARLEIHIVGS